jgi:hypothetical protein
MATDWQKKKGEFSLNTKSQNSEKFAVWLPNEDLAALRAMQEEVGRSVAESIRRAIKLFLHEESKKR